MTKINIRQYLQPKEDECKANRPLSPEDKDEMLEAFLLYDTNRDGLISTKEIGKVIRAYGQIITVTEETDIVAHYALDKCYEIDFITFYRLMLSRRKIFDEDNELREAFRRFDKEENGYVNVDDLRMLLLTTGEPLKEEEVDAWLKDGKEFTSGGKLFYEDFATFMLTK